MKDYYHHCPFHGLKENLCRTAFIMKTVWYEEYVNKYLQAVCCE